jgi:hypothetical protein
MRRGSNSISSVLQRPLPQRLRTSAWRRCSAADGAVRGPDDVPFANDGDRGISPSVCGAAVGMTKVEGMDDRRSRGILTRSSSHPRPGRSANLALSALGGTAVSPPARNEVHCVFSAALGKRSVRRQVWWDQARDLLRASSSALSECSASQLQGLGGPNDVSRSTGWR